jgi:hypothetical protein
LNSATVLKTVKRKTDLIGFMRVLWTDFQRLDKRRKAGKPKLSIAIRIAAIPADGHEWRPAICIAYPEDKMDAWKVRFA